jgi:hypothetical protein
MKVWEAKGNPGYCASFFGPELADGAKLTRKHEEFARVVAAGERPCPKSRADPRAGGGHCRSSGAVFRNGRSSADLATGETLIPASGCCPCRSLQIRYAVPQEG